MKWSAKRQSGSENSEHLMSMDFKLLMAVSAGQTLMNTFFIATLSLYIAKLGGLTVLVGVITTSFVLVALAVRPVAGKLSDKYGRMKLLIAGALISAVACVFFGVVGAIPLLIVIRAVNGIGFGTATTCVGAAAADVLQKNRLGEGIGYFGLAAAVAQAVGPGIALAIAAGDTIGDYRTLFFVAAGINAASAICGCCVSYERKMKKAGQDFTAQKAEKSKNTQEVLDGKLLPKTFLGFEYAVFSPVIVIILMYIGVGSLLSYLTLFARWRGIENPGLFFTISASGTIISRLLFGKVADRHGSDVVLIPGMVVMIASITLTSFVSSYIALIIIALPFGLAHGALMPTFNSMVFRRCSPARRGTASGAFSAAVDAGYAIGAPLLGALADARDYRYIFWVGAIFVIIALVLYILISPDKRYNARMEEGN